MLNRFKILYLKFLLTVQCFFLLKKSCPHICRASAIDPARLNTSKGALFAIALTVRGQESVIQK